jgi:hypothetical protein
MKDSSRFKVLYRTKISQNVIEILYVRSTSQNINPEAIISSLEADEL